MCTHAACFSGLLEMGVNVNGRTLSGCMTYESNVQFALRFMIDKNIVSGRMLLWIAG